MTIPAEVGQKYAYNQPYVSWVAGRVSDTVFQYCNTAGFAFVGRVKDGASTAEKIETGRYKAWSELDDHYACSIVIPSLRDEGPTLEFLKSKFRVLEVRSRASTLKDPAVFRFDATRVVATVPPAGPEVDTNNIRFEVQLRTAFEHAWAVTTHRMAYKGNRIDWRRLRLASQLRASVEQLDLLVAGYDDLAGLIQSQEWPELKIKRAVESLFKDALDRNAIPRETEPQSWVRFCDNVYALVRELSRVLRKRETDVTDELLDLVRSSLPQDAAAFPRSVTLFQFVLAALAKDANIPRRLTGYYAPVTMSLRDLYPEVAEYPKVFDFELGAV